MNKLHLLFILSFSSVCYSQTDVLITDFQTGMPALYSVVDNDGHTPAAQVSQFTSAWITLQDPSNNLDTVAASTSFFSPAGTANRWVITEPIVLGAFGNFIEWEAKSHDPSYPDDYLVLVSTTDAQLASFTDTIGYVIEEYDEWTTRTVDLSIEGYNSQTIYVAFVNVTTDGFILYIDDIHAWKEDPVSVSEIAANLNLSVFPNPTNGEITVSCSENLEKITLYSSTGQQLIQSTESKLNIEALPNGVYFLHVKTAEYSETVKVLKY